MNLSALSLENAPRFWTPLRFFISVPVFGMLAALILFMDGNQLLQSRWHPATLALTHIFTLGYIAMGMLGALLQMLPVVMGASLPRVERSAFLMHLLLAAGALSLVAGFLTDLRLLFAAALLLLVPVLMVFAVAVVLAIWRAGTAGATARAVQIAAVALLVTLGLGAWLVSGYAFEGLQVQRSLTDYHAAWGIIGWILMLIIGVSAQVIPMFLTTPTYPHGFNLWLVYLLMLMLSAGSLLSFAGFARTVTVLVAVLMISYAVVSLYLLARRRRKRFDVTDRFWRLGMLCLIGAGGALLYDVLGGTQMDLDPTVLYGLLLLAGFAVSLINGMLYKIVPFLVWLNLRMPVLKGQVPAGTRLYAPNIHEVISARPMQLQFWLHTGSLLLLLAALFARGLWVYAAAALLLLSNLLLLINLLRAARVYSRCCKARNHP